MHKNAKEYLRHIHIECLYLISICEKLQYEDFVKDETLKRAVVRSLEIVGEASKKIPNDFKDKWKNIQWKNMAGMRDRLIHDYMGVNYTIVWDVKKIKSQKLEKKLPISSMKIAKYKLGNRFINHALAKAASPLYTHSSKRVEN